MKPIVILLLTFLALPGFSQNKGTEKVKTALDDQVNAWNSGKLEEAMAYYHNSPELLWISRTGIEKGYEPIFQSYLKDFANRSMMGTYSYEPLYIEALSGKKVYYVYRWKIELNGRKLMGGVSSQIWKKSGKRWLIFSEHAS